MLLSRELSKLIVENVSDLIRVLNTNFEIQFFNQETHLKTLGYSKEDLHGKSECFFIHPNEINETVSNLKTVKKHNFLTWERRYRHKNGNWIWFEVKAANFKIESGNINTLIIAREIAEKEISNKDSKKSEEHHRLITENIDDIIGIINENLVLEFVNKPSSKRILGFNGNELIGKNPLEFIHPMDYHKTLKAFRSGIIKGKGSLEVRLRHKDGTYSWFELSGNSFIDKFGKKKGIISGRDITKRKEYQEKLYQSEKKYRLISENANDLIAIFNTNFRYEYINGEPHNKFLGYSNKDLIGIYIGKIIHDYDLSQLAKELEENENIWEKTHRLRVRHKNGNWVWMEFRGKIVEESKGNKKYLAIYREITEKIKYEKYLRRENEKLIELEKIRKDFLDIATHELKTPLTSILGSIQIIDDLYSHDLNSEVSTYVDVIRKGVLRLKNLVLNLLDISHLESKDVVLNLEIIDLSDLIHACIFELQQLLDKKDQKVIMDLPKMFKVKIDKQRFERIILNLLSNAIKYSPLNSVINIKLRKLDTSFEFLVKDQGIGINNEEKAKLFKRFSKLDKLRDNFETVEEGTGLGLYITKKIVELHQGRIEVESEGRNKGAKFKVIIPVK